MADLAPSRTPARTVLTAGAVTSLVAGAAAGLVDGVWAWPRIDQFLPDLAGKLRLLVYLATAYGLAALAAGTAATAVGLFYVRYTRLGDLLRHAIAEHRRIRAAEPRDALAGLAMVLVGLPVLGATLAGGYLVGLKVLTGRKHTGLVIVSAMALALAALAVTAAVTLAVARGVELGLRAVTRGRPRLARILSCEHTLRRTALALLAIGGVVVIAAAWPVISVLPWRGPAAVLAAAILAGGYWPAGLRTARRIEAWRLRARLGAAVATVLALALLMVVGGARPAVVKAAVAYSGLGGPIAQSVRRGIDFDHDGFSPVLGGGDCDDLDASVHPGAREIPDDGIDQNCVGGDATTAARPVDDVGFVAPPASLPPDFDVVLITIDTLRADHLGTYGYGRDTSPRLDALAAEGALFVNGWAHAPSTRYSMPAILTGRLPLDVYYDYGVSGWPGILPKATTIAEILRDRGLHTGAVVNYHYFDPYRHMDQGIDPGDYDNSNARLHQGSDPAHTKGSSSREQTDHAIKWLDTLGGQRFFLWVHYYDPHHEYERHREVPQFGDAPMDLYDNEIRWTDSQIGRLFDDLKRRGVWDKTIVVVTGDHGEGFGEHDVTHHGYHLYAAQTKVPFIIKVPGQPPRRITTPVGHVDILPTLADLAGAAPSTEMMGRSLVDLLDGSAPPDRDRVIFQQLSYENHHEMRAAVDQRCHLIYNVSPHTSWEAYRIDVDPAEVHDVSDQPGPCDTVKAAFARWYDGDQIPPGAAEALLPARPTVARELDVDLGREVRLLGVALPAEIQAGATFDVTWTFEARGKLDDGWKVFAHFEQVGGRGRFTGDHEPARPFAWWRRGQYIQYTRQVSVPRGTPPGDYALWAGLWKGNARRPARAGGDAPVEIVDDRARVATIRVTR